MDDNKLCELKKIPQPIQILDGCTAAVHVAYACSDTAFIFPITPSSSMAETADLFAYQGRKNVHGQLLEVRQMQSEAGAAGAMHGALVVGSLATTFTSSQGLLLMIPNMYKIAGELMPCVMHVAARAIATQALSIFGDHSDVMAVRSTGWTMLSACSVQETMDMSLISQICTLKSRVPVINFFDGFRTSHEIQKVFTLSNELIAALLPWDAIDAHRKRGLNPTHPHQIGTAQGPEILFQNVEAANTYYNKVPEILEEVMNTFSAVVGRKYELFSYHGAEDAERVVIIMGAAAKAVTEVVGYLTERGEKVGVLTVHAFRPWSLRHFIAKLPKTTKVIAVLDRTKEAGALGEPLFLDVSASLHMSNLQPIVCGARYGLASKDFTPPMIFAIYEELKKANPRRMFTVGIFDDVTNLSLDYTAPEYQISTVPKGTIQCMFWGMGSDGTVGANKNVIKIIGEGTNMQVQGYFAYSAHKAGGITVSHLRFGPQEMTSQYLINEADYLAVHREKYVKMFKITKYLKTGAAFVLNTKWTPEELEHELPGSMRRDLAKKDIRVYTIDAGSIAKATGMGRRINNILMTVFFKLSGVLPMDEAFRYFKAAIQKTYGRKGQHVVDMNNRAVDVSNDAVHEVKYDREKWLNAHLEPKAEPREEAPDFVTNVLMALEKLEGDDLPVSAVMPTVGGIIPLGTAAYEKRGIALTIPIVDMDKCTQCNYCSFVCPHAAIRPFLIDEDEAERAPESFAMKKAKGNQDIAAFRYRIQVAPEDCTGCSLCAIACPDDALTMLPYEDHAPREDENWDWAIKLENRGELVGPEVRKTLKGSQFQIPLMEFSGACEGCGETPYVKLLTQLFGERMVIANATGCTSIWGASYPSTPYTMNERGHGPAWGNSLFEDNAEYGYGMVVASNNRRKRLHELASVVLNQTDSEIHMSDELRQQLSTWVEKWDDPVECQRLLNSLPSLLESHKAVHPNIERLATFSDMIPKFSNWMIGGDGWAYDIGYGGLDHVVAGGENVNILVLDTEVYSNTGGQVSKATPLGAVHKFGMGGHLKNKKDLGMILMEYGHVYVASCSELANMSQTVRAFLEAESYDGPSVMICYAPCIEHQYIKPFSMQQMHCKMAVDSGYWPLYRYDPRLRAQGQNPFQLDSKKIRGDLKTLLHKENRFESLWRDNPQLAETVEGMLVRWCTERFERLQIKAEGLDTQAGIDALRGGQGKSDDNKIHILYGTETGNTEEVARRIAAMLKQRQLTASLIEFSDIDVEDVVEMHNVLILCCTQGQGQMPEDTKEFWAALSKHDLPADLLKNTQYAVFGLGDSSYIYFNEAAKNLDARFAELGAKRLLECGKGDDQHPEKFDGALSDWLPDYFTELKAPEPVEKEVPDDPMFRVTPTHKCNYVMTRPVGSTPVQIVVNRRMTPDDYDVDVRHIEFNLSGTGIKYQLGDSLSLWPRNLEGDVSEFCKHMGYDKEQCVKVEKAGQEGSAKHEALFTNPVTIGQIIAEVLDICGRPTRRFYESLWKYCVDESERKDARSLLDKSRADHMSFLTNKLMVNIFDLFKKYPSAKPTIEQLIDLVPLVRPRAYSIASSQKFVGDTNLHLCVGIVDWVVPETKALRHGSCTGFLRSLDINAKYFVSGSIRPTAFNMPPTNMHPMIMAGMGTGLAPFRSFIQYRAWLKRSGKEVGPVVLYFGCRYQSKDFLYGDELKAFEAEGVISELRTAFSRDQAKKFYVQHTIDNEPSLLYKRLVAENGFFYLCGSAKQVPIDVRAAIERALVSEGKMTSEEATETITQMLIKGQYNLEAW